MNPIMQMAAEMDAAPSLVGSYSSSLLSDLLLNLAQDSAADVDTFTVTVWWGTKKHCDFSDTCRFGRESLSRHCPIWVDAILYGPRSTISILVKDDKDNKHGFVFSH